jgi:hypothetical protein
MLVAFDLLRIATICACGKRGARRSGGSSTALMEMLEMGHRNWLWRSYHPMRLPRLQGVEPLFQAFDQGQNNFERVDRQRPAAQCRRDGVDITRRRFRNPGGDQLRDIA